MSLKNVRLEVMQYLEKDVDSLIEKYLIPIDNIWQPTDFLPNSEGENFMEEVKEIRELSKELPYDFWVVLVRSEEHTSELQSRENLVCRLLLEKKKDHFDIVEF